MPLPGCHCGHRLLLVTDELAPIVPLFRGLWCVDCQEESDPDCGSDPEAAHLEPVTPELAWWGRRACPICGAEYGEPHNWDVHSAEARV